MRLLEELTVSHGAKRKRIELYHGDLVAIPPEHAVDVLVLSAWPGDYRPVSGTVIGALSQKGISVADLARRKAVDLREMCSCWLSEEIRSEDPGIHFKRILCFEPYNRGQPPEVIGDIFQSLMPFANDEGGFRKIVMSLVATGCQGVPLVDILEPLLEASVHWLKLGLPVEVLKIVEFSETKAFELKGAFSVLKRSIGEAQVEWTQQYKHDLFVSYSHENTDEVMSIVKQMEALRPNLNIFFDRTSLNEGMAWQQEIYEALDDCDKVVAVYSPAYLRSKVCREEFNIAIFRHREEEDILYPIYLEQADLPTYMKLIQFADFRELSDDLRLQRCEELLGKLGK